MALSFNHATRRIFVPRAEAQPLLLQTLLNAIREEEASDRGINNDPIAEASGKDSLGGGVTTGITVRLLSTWLIEFEAGNYQARIDGGNLAESLSRVANTGNPQVVIQSSVATTLAASDGSVVQPGPSLSLDDIAAVMRAELAKVAQSGSITGHPNGKPLVVLPGAEQVLVVPSVVAADLTKRGVVRHPPEPPAVVTEKAADLDTGQVVAIT